MIFLLLLVYISVIAYIFSNIKPVEKAKKQFVALAFIAIGIIVAFRGLSVGADTQNYARLYTELYYGIFKHYDAEPGFVYLVKFLNIFSRDARLLFIVQGALVTFSYSYFIIKNTENVQQAYIAVLSYLAFNLFSFNISGVRQSIAMCICLLAFEMIKRKKIVWFFLLVLLATQFHTSAWLFLPAYFLYNLKEWMSLSITAVVGILGLFSMNFMMDAVNLILDDRFSQYGIEETGNGFIFVAVMTVILAFYLIFKKPLTKENENLFNHGKVNYFCYALWLIRLVTRVIERVTFFYLPSTMIVLAQTPRAIKNKDNKTLYTAALCIFLMALFLYRIRGYHYVFM